MGKILQFSTRIEIREAKRNEENNIYYRHCQIYDIYTEIYDLDIKLFMVYVMTPFNSSNDMAID
jgi:hypothetical protein